MDQLFDGKRAYEHIRILSKEIGTRLSGTEGEKKAIQYTKNILSSFGLNTSIQSFKVQADTLIKASLEIIDPEALSIDCNAQLGSGTTPENGITAELVFAEGNRDPIINTGIKGKILVLSPHPENEQDFRYILQYEPAAIIKTGNNALQQAETMHFLLHQSILPYHMVPTLYISYLDADKIKKYKSKKAKLTLCASNEESFSQNIIAELPGTEKPNEIITICGHIDSVPANGGATDNAGGVGTMIELARVFSQKGSKRTLRFAAWGTEEQAGLGSAFYMLDLKKKSEQEKQEAGFISGFSKTTLENHLLCINLDVLGTRIGHNSCYITANDEVGHYIKAIGYELGNHIVIKNSLYPSDNVTFSFFGVPSVAFTREGAGFQLLHTRLDQLDLIDETQLEITGKLVEQFISRSISNGILYPFSRAIPESQAKQLKEWTPYVQIIEKTLFTD